MIEVHNTRLVLGKVQELCQELTQQEIIYCHWKSNAALDRACSGETDLDLLVSRVDVQRFIEVLIKLGFKPALDRSVSWLPGVMDYYAYDQMADRLVHVHAHYQLILGHDATKNYHLPIEEPYLASSTFDDPLMVPAVEFELIVLIIRLMLKHSTWDTQILHQGKLSQSEKNELVYLLERSSESKLGEIIKAHLPTVPHNLLNDCLHVLSANSTAFERIRVGQRLLNCLDAYARRPELIDNFLKIWRRIAWPIKVRIIDKSDKKQFASGGLLIAVIGGDGAGKTTIVEEIYRWLSNDFRVYRFHVGKPDWSILTFLVRGFVKVGRSLGFYPFMRAEIQYTHDADRVEFPGYPWLIREICTARDRFLTYRKARCLATNGAVVILDRFPLPQIEFMDGPQVARMTGKLATSKLLSYLIDLEEGFYRKIILPDLLIVLRVDPEEAVRRKIDEDPEEVHARSTEIWDLNWKETSAVEIDANRSKEEVLLEVKDLVWSRL